MGKYHNPQITLDLVNDSNLTKETRSLEQGYKEAKNVFFAFIDVLGFTHDFYSHRSDPEQEEKDSTSAKKYAQLFTYYFKLLNESTFSKGENYYAGQTSDSLYFYTANPEILRIFVHLYCHFNLVAMSQNVFFRGGIAKGVLYIHQEYQFYGTSVINAYKLESEIAQNPTLYFDENTYKVLKEDPLLEKYIKDEYHQNGRYRLKPFEAYNDNIDNYLRDGFLPDEIQTVDLEIIKQTIENNRKTYEFDNSTYNKYLFLSKELTALKKERG